MLVSRTTHEAPWRAMPDSDTEPWTLSHFRVSWSLWTLGQWPPNFFIPRRIFAENTDHILQCLSCYWEEFQVYPQRSTHALEQLPTCFKIEDATSQALTLLSSSLQSRWEGWLQYNRIKTSHPAMCGARWAPQTPLKAVIGKARKSLLEEEAEGRPKGEQVSGLFMASRKPSPTIPLSLN